MIATAGILLLGGCHPPLDHGCSPSCFSRRAYPHAGSNDINDGKTPQQVLEDFKTFVNEVTRKLGNLEIAFISIAGNPARWSQIERVREANALVASYAKENRHVEFIDVFSHMMAPNGLPKPDIFIDDRLHMNEKGYKIWRAIVAPYVMKR
ncbi:MAG TPA: GDSL-type esterase/lipase family protein [Opitutaceae bacterium]